MQKMMDDIREGTLDYVLTKPLDAQLLVSVREARVWRLVDALGGLTVIVYALTQVERAVGWEDVAGFLVMISLGAAMLYCFWLVLATMAFWVVRIWAVNDLFEGLYQTGRWPIGIYPGWLRYGLTFLVPIGFAVTVPAQAVTARLDWGTAAAASAFALVAIVLSRAIASAATPAPRPEPHGHAVRSRPSASAPRASRAGARPRRRRTSTRQQPSRA
jgi:ABC-2 type transport system permease protein